MSVCARVSLCAHVYVCACIACVFQCVCVCTSVCVFQCVCVHVLACMCTCQCVFQCVCARVSVCVSRRVHVSVCGQVYLCFWHMCVCLPVCPPVCTSLGRGPQGLDLQVPGFADSVSIPGVTVSLHKTEETKRKEWKQIRRGPQGRTSHLQCKRTVPPHE